MKIKSISVGGFKNLKKSTLQLDNITAIISPNNYGKSNLLEAIDFGIEFLSSNFKDRKVMMKWTRGIPINKGLENDEFFFELELEDEKLGDYRYIRYGFTFRWFRDDGTGQCITNEWIETRPNESVRYTAYLKRSEGKYRKAKETASYRKIKLEDSQLAIDILSAMEDIAIQPVIKTISKVSYHVCSSLDLGDRFQAAPIEYVESNDDGCIAFDDKDVPRALFQLRETDPEKYDLFLEAVYALFPEFSDVSIQSFSLNIEQSELNILVSTDNSELLPAPLESLEQGIPFKIRDELYRIVITNKHLNQPINISMMSTGTKRIFWLLANIFIASSKGMSFIGVEELETSIHPRLLKGLLEILDEVLDDTSLIISSHSPFLVQYIKAEKIYAGVPNSDGIAEFKKTKNSKIKALVKTARDNGMAVGEYLFELMAGDQDSIDTLSFYLED